MSPRNPGKGWSVQGRGLEYSKHTGWKHNAPHHVEQRWGCSTGEEGITEEREERNNALKTLYILRRVLLTFRSWR